jgi:hypothetical protein
MPRLHQRNRFFCLGTGLAAAATTVVITATATIATAAESVTTAAADDNEDQDDPEATAASKVVATHIFLTSFQLILCGKISRGASFERKIWVLLIKRWRRSKGGLYGAGKESRAAEAAANSSAPQKAQEEEWWKSIFQSMDLSPVYLWDFSNFGRTELDCGQ